MPRKKSSQPEKIIEDAIDSSIDKTLNSELTLEELLFINIDYKDIEKLRKLRQINNRKQIDIINKLKACIKEAI